MSDKKQSSVDWLINELIRKSEFKDLPNNYYLMADKDIDKIIEQAKAMHEEEIRRAWCDGFPFTWANSNQTAKEYYNETFGK